MKYINNEQATVAKKKPFNRPKVWAGPGRFGAPSCWWGSKIKGKEAIKRSQISRKHREKVPKSKICYIKLNVLSHPGIKVGSNQRDSFYFTVLYRLQCHCDMALSHFIMAVIHPEGISLNEHWVRLLKCDRSPAVDSAHIFLLTLPTSSVCLIQSGHIPKRSYILRDVNVATASGGAAYGPWTYTKSCC